MASTGALGKRTRSVPRVCQAVALFVRLAPLRVADAALYNVAYAVSADGTLSTTLGMIPALYGRMSAVDISGPLLITDSQSDACSQGVTYSPAATPIQGAFVLALYGCSCAFSVWLRSFAHFGSTV